MKKIFATILAITMAFGMVSCGSSASKDASSSSKAKSSASQSAKEDKEPADISKDTEEWLLNTSLDNDQPANLQAALRSSSGFVGNAFFHSTYDGDYWNDTYPEIKLTEANLKFLGDKCTYNGEPLSLSDTAVTEKEGYNIYSRLDTNMAVLNRHSIYNIDGNLILSLNGEYTGDSGIGYPTYGYTPSAVHIYDKDGNELKKYDIKYQSCYAGFYALEDLPADAAAYSIDLVDSYDGLDTEGYSTLVQEQVEEGKDMNILPVSTGIGDVLGLAYFGYDDDSLDDDSKNPYAGDLDKAQRFMIFRKKSPNNYKYHIALAGFTLNKDGTLSDMEKRTFAVDENTQYATDLLTENKIWFFINE